MMKVIKNMIKAPTNSSTILKECIEQVAISVITVQLHSNIGDPNATYQEKVKNYLSQFKNTDIDVIVLPEMALTGYDFLGDFDKLLAVSEFKGQENNISLESSILTNYQIAKEIALDYNCYVVLGYPEKVEMYDSEWESYNLQESFDG